MVADVGLPSGATCQLHHTLVHVYATDRDESTIGSQGKQHWIALLYSQSNFLLSGLSHISPSKPKTLSVTGHLYELSAEKSDIAGSDGTLGSQLDLVWGPHSIFLLTGATCLLDRDDD